MHFGSGAGLFPAAPLSSCVRVSCPAVRSSSCVRVSCPTVRAIGSWRVILALKFYAGVNDVECGSHYCSFIPAISLVCVVRTWQTKPRRRRRVERTKRGSRSSAEGHMSCVFTIRESSQQSGRGLFSLSLIRVERIIVMRWRKHSQFLRNYTKIRNIRVSVSSCE